MDYWERINSMIRYENDLLNQRLTWLATFEGLLFTAYFVAIDKVHDQKWMSIVFASTGMLVALSIWVGTLRSNRAISSLTAIWDNNRPIDYSGPDVQGVRSDEGKSAYFMPGYFLPALLWVAWPAVIWLFL